VDEQVKHLPQNEQLQKWREGAIEYAKTTQLDKLGKDFKRVGLSTLTDILNVVAPPISEHEVIQVWLSHDMQGYEGVETVVYRSMSKVMEQIKGGDLVVNRGNEAKPKEGGDVRELNAAQSYSQAIKVAKVNVESMVKANVKTATPSAINTPTTYSNVYIRVQPFLTKPPSSDSDSDDSSDESSSDEDSSSSDGDSTKKSSESRLQFLIYLYDPEHKLTQKSVTQAVSSGWLALWDEYDWVEDLVADALRLGVEVVGQEYLVSRMGWADAKKPSDATSTTPADQKPIAKEGE